jgi:DNA-binding transcriptional LysR family regulator
MQDPESPGARPVIAEKPRELNLLRRGIKLSHLRLISALKDTGQMSAAAAQLAISQPAASRLSAELEQILGVPLHNRHSRGVTLTLYGEQMARRAQTILRNIKDTGREIVELESGHRGSVSVGSVTGPAVELVLPVIRQLRVTHPQISVSVLVDTSDALADAVLAGKLDFFLGRIPDNHDPRLFETRVFGEEPVSLIVRPDHPLTQKSAIALEDLIAFDWVMQEEGALMRRTVEGYLIHNAVPLPQRVLSTSSLLLTLATISQTNAVAPVARSVALFMSGSDGLDGRLRTLDVARDLAVTPYYLISNAAEEHAPAPRIFIESLIRTFAGLSNADIE